MIGRLRDSSLIPVSVVVAFIILIWYAGAVYLNSPVLIDRYERQKTAYELRLSLVGSEMCIRDSIR